MKKIELDMLLSNKCANDDMRLGYVIVIGEST